MIAPRILRKKRSRLTLGLEIAEPAVWVCVSDLGLSSAGRSVAARELRRRERRGGQNLKGLLLTPSSLASLFTQLNVLVIFRIRLHRESGSDVS